MNRARALAQTLRSDPNVTPTHCALAAETIDLLLDLMAAQRGPVAEPPVDMDLEALRQLRRYHYSEWQRSNSTGNAGVTEFHARFVRMLNKYFNDKLDV